MGDNFHPQDNQMPMASSTTGGEVMNITINNDNADSGIQQHHNVTFHNQHDQHHDPNQHVGSTMEMGSNTMVIQDSSHDIAMEGQVPDVTIGDVIMNDMNSQANIIMGHNNAMTVNVNVNVDPSASANTNISEVHHGEVSILPDPVVDAPPAAAMNLNLNAPPEGQVSVEAPAVAIDGNISNNNSTHQDNVAPPMPEIGTAAPAEVVTDTTNQAGTETETGVGVGASVGAEVSVDNLHLALDIPKVQHPQSKVEETTPMEQPPQAPNPTNTSETTMPKLYAPTPVPTATATAAPSITATAITTITPIPHMIHTPPPHMTLRLPPAKSSTKQERMDAIWMKHYGELQGYKVQNGHVRVPRKSGPLGEWVRTQRRYYKLWRRGESVPLTKERMELLDQLGFVWLPAEEKIGGGFRGGRPKKRKRDEEDALAAANAAAAAAAVVGAGGVSVYTNNAFYHQLVSPAMHTGAGVVNTPMVVPNADGTVPAHASMATTTITNLDGTTQQVQAGAGAGAGLVTGTTNTTPTTLGAVVGTPAQNTTFVSGLPYNYHHDPYYLHSMSKRSDIANQIALLEKHQPISRHFSSPGPKETYKTQSLTDAHSRYEDVVSVLKRSNEELRDAELALDRAKKTYEQAQTLKDKADILLSDASEEVLKIELEDGDDEWIAMYKCLLKYNEQNGNILFPRLSNNSNSNSSTTNEDNDSAEKVDGGGNDGGENNLVSYGTMNILTDISASGVKIEDGSLPIPPPVATSSENTDQPPPQATEALVLENPDQPPTQVVDDSNQKLSSEHVSQEVLEQDVKMEVSELGGQTISDIATAAPEPNFAEGIVVTETKNGAEAMDIDCPMTDNATEGNQTTEAAPPVDHSVAVDTTAFENVSTNVDSTAAVATNADGTIAVENTENPASTVEVTEPILHEWVGKMRKFPKKQLKKWRRHALDNLGFVWHQYNATWTDRYRELVEFRGKHGHTVVPTSNSNLGIWVGTQRKQYRLMQQGKPSHMTVERVEMLNQIDFVWHVNTWNERYEELKTFKEQFGHFLVPTDHQNRQLRPWITTQRSHYRFLQEGKPSQLTQERIELLDKIGFPWKTREDWQTRYQELVRFIEMNGTCAVPRNYSAFPKLYRWVNCQRMEYQKYTEGSGSRLKADQISLLENVGFE